MRRRRRRGGWRGRRGAGGGRRGRGGAGCSPTENKKKHKTKKKHKAKTPLEVPPRARGLLLGAGGAASAPGSTRNSSARCTCLARAPRRPPGSRTPGRAASGGGRLCFAIDPKHTCPWRRAIPTYTRPTQVVAPGCSSRSPAGYPWPPWSPSSGTRTPGTPYRRWDRCTYTKPQGGTARWVDRGPERRRGLLTPTAR